MFSLKIPQNLKVSRTAKYHNVLNPDNKYRLSLCVLCGLLLIYNLSVLSCERPEHSRADVALGTVCTVTLFDQGKSSIYNDIFKRISEIENLMSVRIPTSDISRINAAAGIKPVQVHEETFKVIKRAVYYAELCGGAFDPTIGPLVSLWGFYNDNPRIPSQEEIDIVLPLINWRNIELDPETNSVFLTQHNMTLDLGAIAKGYAADESARIAREAGITAAIIDLGGDIMLLGVKKDKSLWKVGLQNPDEDQGFTIGYLQIPESSVVTSGVYERFFIEEGIRYHHIFQPSDGYPVNNGLLSVTIIAKNSMDADALSTAAFVLGYQKGRVLIESLPSVEAVFIFQDYTIRTTTGVNLVITDKSFNLLTTELHRVF